MPVSSPPFLRGRPFYWCSWPCLSSSWNLHQGLPVLPPHVFLQVSPGSLLLTNVPGVFRARRASLGSGSLLNWYFNFSPNLSLQVFPERVPSKSAFTTFTPQSSKASPHLHKHCRATKGIFEVESNCFFFFSQPSIHEALLSDNPVFPTPPSLTVLCTWLCKQSSWTSLFLAFPSHPLSSLPCNKALGMNNLFLYKLKEKNLYKHVYVIHPLESGPS